MKTTIKKKHWRPFLKLLSDSRLPWAGIVLSVCLSLLGTRIGVELPKVQQAVTDGDLSLGAVGRVLIVMALMLVVGAISTAVGGYARYKINRNLAGHVWTKLLALPMALYQKLNPRELISRTTIDTSTLSDVFITCINALLSNTFGLILAIQTLFTYHPHLAYIQLVMIPLMLIQKLVEGYFGYRLFYRQQEQLARFTQYISETLSHLPIVKVFVKEEKEKKRGGEYIRQYNRARFHVNALNITFVGLDNMTLALNQIITVVYGALLIRRGEITIGIWIAYFMFTNTINSSVNLITQLWPLIKQAQGAIDRVVSLVSSTPERKGGDKPASDNDTIRFDHVSFSYEGKKILDDVSLSIEKNRTTAIVGPSGSGKTTLLNLIEGFYEPDDGQIFFGAQTLRTLDLKMWRHLLSYVSQDFHLYSGPLRDSLLLGLNEIPGPEKFTLALKNADAEKLFLRHPDGLAQSVQDAGANFSGGERQRLALARMFLQNRRIVLLDEATFNLDGHSENKVMQALCAFKKDRTVVMVAHRLSAVRDADKIIVLEGGKVAAQGTHESLLSTSAIYRRLFLGSEAQEKHAREKETQKEAAHEERIS